MLKRLSRDAVLSDPVHVEKFVFALSCSNKTRSVFFDAYRHYCIANSIVWARPSLFLESYPVKVPTEERINLIISTATKRYATIFHISKHGLRPDEVSKIILRDIDLERGELTVRTSKLGLQRTLKLKAETRDLLNEYVRRYKIDSINERLFPGSKTIKEKWRFYRRRAYEKFKDTELLKIRLYDLRHWYGTMSYIRSRDIFHVKYLMGHRDIKSTLYYMHVAKGMISYSDEYSVKVAATIGEFTSLLESGFEYVSDYDGKRILRKRK
jgi:integrase